MQSSRAHLRTSLSSGRWVFGVLAASVLSMSVAEPVHEALPVGVAARQRQYVSRIPLDLSADGQWIGYTYQSDEDLLGFIYSNTGVPGTDGLRRLQAELINVRTGEIVPLGTRGNSSWAPIWSPDGRRVAFYSDEGGEAGLWIWDRATRKSHRFPRVRVRPYFGFETVHWTSDSNRLICQILPSGWTIARANSLLPRPEDPEALHFRPVGKTEPSVLIFHSASSKREVDSTVSAASVESTSALMNNIYNSDLAILDLRTLAVTRIVEHVNSRWAEFSPDNRYLAYATYHWINSSMAYDLIVHDLTTKRSRILAHHIGLHAGAEVSWAPDSRHIAYHTIESSSWDPNRPYGRGSIFIADVDGSSKEVSLQPGFELGAGAYRAPLWDARSLNIYEASGGHLWKIDVHAAQAKVLSQAADHEVVALVGHRDRRTVFSGGDETKLWMLTHNHLTGKFCINSFDTITGRSRLETDTEQTIQTTYDLAANDNTGEVAFTADDQQRPLDVWAYNIATRRTRQLTHINAELSRYEFGTARIINWRGLQGQSLRGALLLPPNYRPGLAVPMVVWVYGSDKGSDYVNQFGFVNEPVFNMQVLATRGFAVLYPDAPLRQGSPMRDLYDTVMPGVNAAINQGYADPERLAVMGQSYGSYSALALIVQTNQFKAAIITGAILHPDLFADYLQGPMGPDGINSYYEKGLGNMGGSPWEYRDRYLNNSPLFSFDRIQTPVLIAQGARDTPLSASRAIFFALRRLGKDVEYRVYENEDHVIEKTPNVVDIWNRRIQFLDEHLSISRDAAGRIAFSRGRISESEDAF